MQTTLDKKASIILYFICFLTIIFSLRFIHNQTKWSPIDEYSHMAYIEELGEGRLPKLSNLISVELFLHITNDTLRNSIRNVKTYEELGLAGICYEAIHPPLYYALLTPPNLLLKKMGVKIFYRLKILRLFSYMFFVIGMFMCLPLFKSLNKLGYAIPYSYGLGCVLFGLLIATHQRYGLGNNMLTPLMVNVTGIFLIKYYQKPEDKNLYLFVLFVLFSVFTALSTVFILPALCLVMLLKYRSHITLKNFVVSASMVITAVVLFMSWKRATIPAESVNDYVQRLLTLYIPAGLLDFKTFYSFWMNDTFTLSFIRNNFDISMYIFVLMIVSTCVCIRYFRTIIKEQKWLLTVGLLFLSLLLSTFVANNYIATVHWVAFRHFLGFIPVLYVMCTAFLLVLYVNYFKNKK